MSASAAPISHARTTHQRGWLAVILLVVLFFSYIDRINVSILVVDQRFLSDMGIVGQAVQKGLLMTVFLAAYGVGNVVLSPIGDYLGARKAMSLSILAWAVSLLVGGIAETFTVMLLSRVMLGFGEGLHFPMQSKYVKEWFPLSERGKANAVWQAGLSVAPALSLPVFSFIVEHGGWRASFLTLAISGIIPLVLVWFFTADTPRQSTRVSPSELTFIESGLRKGQEETVADATVWNSLRAVAANRPFWLLCAYYALHNAIFWGALTWLPAYLKEARGFSWSSMGLLSSLPWVVALITKFIGGYLCDVTGRRAPIVVVAMVCTGVGVYFGATLTDANLSVAMLALGIGALGLALPAVWTMLQDLVGSRVIGMAAGLMNGLAAGFSALAPLIIGVTISMTGSYVGGLLCMVGCSACAGLIMVMLAAKGH